MPVAQIARIEVYGSYGQRAFYLSDGAVCYKERKPMAGDYYVGQNVNYGPDSDGQPTVQSPANPVMY